MVTLASHLEHHGPLSTRAAFSVLWQGSPRLVRSLDQRLVEWSQTESHRALAVHALLRMGRMGDVNRERIGLVSASMNTLERGEMASVIADALAGQDLTV